jgi:tetratricopeptide (TPR) repeat protein
MRISAGPFTDPRQLAAIDGLIAASPDQIGLRFGRACCLEDLGRTGEAIAAYLDVLAREPEHFGALTNLGCLLFERERIADAEPYVRDAARLHPGDPVALVNLARLDAATGDAAAAVASYEAALAADPDALHAHLGLAELFRRRGDDARAQTHVDRAYAKPRVWRFPCRSGAPSLRVLVLVSAAGGDLVMNRYLDDREVEATVLLADSVRGPIALPEHDLAFNAIGDADRCRASLERAQAICANLTVPVINGPAAVVRTGRVEMMRRLRDLPAVRAPRTEAFARDALTADVSAVDPVTRPSRRDALRARRRPGRRGVRRRVASRRGTDRHRVPGPARSRRPRA